MRFLCILALTFTTFVSANHFPLTNRLLHHRDLVSPRSTSNGTQSVVSSAWYAAWHAADYPLDQVSWSKYTYLTYAFALLTPKAGVISLQPSDEELLPQFVSAAHKNNANASLSIGGWTGSQYFSTNVGSAENRTAFVKAVVKIAQQYKLDGIDFDWEYPGLQGIGCNVVSPNDTSNYLSFLQELRATPTGRSLLLTAAVYTKPFADTSGQPSTDLSGFSQVLDYIAIMNYDTKSTPSTGAGPSSPLYDSCAPTGAQTGSAMSAISAWMSAGIPASQILLGVPAYGHSFVIPPSIALPTSSQNSTLTLFPAYDPNSVRVGDKWDDDGGIDICGNTQGPGGVYSYWGLIQNGFLRADGTVSDGIDYHWDECSQTPFLYDRNKQVYISYDDTQSYTAKGNFINVTGLAGFAMWEAGGDYKDILLDSIVMAARNGDPTRFNPPSISAQNVSPTSNNNSSSSSEYIFLPSFYYTTCIIISVLSPLLLLR